MTSHGLNISRRCFVSSRSRLGLVALTCLGLVSVSRLWRLGLVSVSASYVSFTTLLYAVAR